VSKSPTIHVEVVYATPGRQEVVVLELTEGATVALAIAASGMANLFDDFDADTSRLGIFSRKVGPDHALRDGDRVEVYRPLVIDPKEARRQRAQLQSGD
jgi:putative ubiquitin-RnfH superfamily antitoxin RatB of RatAB toxin-antitoxin module